MGRRAALGTLTLLAGASLAMCLSPTQIEIEITTDVPCKDLGGVTLTVGTLGANGGVEDRAPTTQTSQCDPQTGRIGSLVVVPSGDRSELVAVKIVGARGRSPEECRAPDYGPDCIVARRALRFVPATGLRLPIVLRGACAGKPCAPTETCVGGTCVPALISDPSACASAGCDETALGDAGPPPADAAPTPDAAPPDAGPPDVVVPPDPFCDPTNGDLIGCYRFDGQFRDESQYGHQPTTTTNATFEVGKVGQAMRLVAGAAPSLVSVPYGTSGPSWNSTQITLEAWIKPMAVPSAAGNGRAGVVDNENRFGIFYYADGTMLCRAAEVIGQGTKLPVGIWTHFTCVWDGNVNGVITYYVNGVPTGPLTGSVLQSVNIADNMWFGANAPAGGDHFDGLLDEVRIWRVARSPAQIAAAAARGR